MASDISVANLAHAISSILVLDSLSSLATELFISSWWTGSWRLFISGHFADLLPAYGFIRVSAETYTLGEFGWLLIEALLLPSRRMGRDNTLQFRFRSYWL
jgi:hypothetical protein